MKLTIGEAREFVRARLDELSAVESDMLHDIVDDRNLDNTIDKLIEDAIIYTHLAAPASLMEGPVLTESSFPSGAIEVRDRVLDMDTVLAETDDDILRMISFQCGDSDIKLTSFFYEDSPEARMQLNQYIQGQPDSPALVRLDDSPNFRPHYRYYTTDMRTDGTGRTLRFTYRYFARPKLKAGSASLSPSSLTFTYVMQSKTIEVTSSSAWRMTSTLPDWLFLSDLSGAGNTTISVTAKANGDSSQRTASLTFVNEEGSTALEIVQKGYSEADTGASLRVICTSTAYSGGTLTLSPLSAAYTYYFRVSAQSGLEWSAALSDWTNFTISPVSGTGDGMDTYSLVAVKAKDSNYSGLSRAATITFSASGVDSVVINLLQPTALFVNPLNMGADGLASSAVFQIVSSGSWIASILTAIDGFVLSSYSGNGTASITATWPQNDTGETRNLTFQVRDVTTARTVTIVQQPVSSSDYISVSPSSLTMPYSADTSSVTIASSGEWEVDSESLPFWMTATKNGSTLQLASELNGSASSRTGTVKVLLSGNTSYYATVLVVQEGNRTVASVITLSDTSDPTDSVTVSSSGGTFSCNLTSNTDWTLSSPNSWIHITSPTSGSGDATVSFTVDSGSAAEDGTIVATITGTAKSATYYVFREAPAPSSDYITITRRDNSFYNNVEVGNDLNYEGFDVKSSGAWTATTSASWLNVYGSAWRGGKGTSTRWFSAEANSGAPRIGIITATLTSTGDTDVFYAYQAGDGTTFLTASFSKTSIDSTAQEIYLTIISNVNWTINGISGGLSVPTLSGYGNSEITVLVSSASFARTLSLTVQNVAYGLSAVATVSQTAPVDSTYLRISPNGSKSVDYDETSQKISIESNVSWALSCNDAGVTLSPSSGSNNGTVMAYFEANQSTSSTRSFTITARTTSGTTITKTLTITQAVNSASVLTVSPATVSLPGSGGSATITVSSSSVWAVSSSVSWINLSTISGREGTGLTFTLSALANSGSQRTGTVTVSNGSLVKTVTVAQSASMSLSTDMTEVSLGSERGMSSAVRVYASGEWEIVNAANLPVWLSCSAESQVGSPTGESLVFTTLLANTGSEVNTTTVRIHLKDDTSSYVILTVTQAIASALSVSPSVASVSARVSEVEVNVTSNTSWEAYYLSDGLSIGEEDVSGTGNKTFTIGVTSNPGMTPRTLRADFQTTDGRTTAAIVITQAAAEISVSPASLEFAASGGSRSATVISSAYWEVASKPSWLSYVRPSDGIANNPDGAAIALEANESILFEERTGTVVFRQKYYPDNTATVTVKQKAATAETLSISPSIIHGETADAFTGTIEVTANCSWTITKVEDDLTFSAMSGNGDATITYRVAQNTTGNLRRIWARFASENGGVEATLYIWHPATGQSIVFSPDVKSIIFYEDEPEAELEVTATQDWTAESSAAWLNFSPSSGLAGETVTVRFTPLIHLTRHQNAMFTVTTTGGTTKSIRMSSYPSDTIIIDE